MLVTFAQREFFYQGNDREKPQRGKLLANAVGGESFHSLHPGRQKDILQCLCERLRVSRGQKGLSTPSADPGLPGTWVQGTALGGRFTTQGAVCFNFLSSV